MTTITITIAIWHNVARDQDDRPTGMLEGYHPGDPAVRVFTYQADPAGRTPEQIAEEAFAICNGHRPTPSAKTWPAAITSASCGRCRWATSWPPGRSRWRPAGPPGGGRPVAA
jgi:hypothetical protein